MASASKYLKIVVGLLLMAIGAYGIAYFWLDFVNLFKGAIGVIIILIGLLIVAIGASD